MHSGRGWFFFLLLFQEVTIKMYVRRQNIQTHPLKGNTLTLFPPRSAAGSYPRLRSTDTGLNVIKLRPIQTQSCMCTLRGRTVVHTSTQRWQLPPAPDLICLSGYRPSGGDGCWDLFPRWWDKEKKKKGGEKVVWGKTGWRFLLVDSLTRALLISKTKKKSTEYEKNPEGFGGRCTKIKK